MKYPAYTKKPSVNHTTVKDAFTLVELLAVVTIIAVLAGILLPALSNAREHSRGIFCLNNTKQLTLVWQLYADDHDGLLPYNLSMSSSSLRTNINWVNNVMTWDLSPDNTNQATITEASLGRYVSGATGIFRCPSDNTLSSVQRNAGWNQRVRSYSMNGMIGNAGPLTVNGVNVNNPTYHQFFKLDQIPHTTDIFVFLDEHPDSIDDGYFMNKDTPTYGYTMNSVSANEWIDLPASYHNRSTAFSFADGHASLHRWTEPTTYRPSQPFAANLPIQIPISPSGENSDFEWVMDHMSVEN